MKTLVLVGLLTLFSGSLAQDGSSTTFSSGNRVDGNISEKNISIQQWS